MIRLRKRWLWLAAGALLFPIIGIVSLHAWKLLPTPVAMARDAARDQQVVDDPCWFQKGEEVIKGSSTLAAQAKLRTDRQIFGYPNKISLKEAVALFNSEEKCVPFRGTLPPLTEDEVVAAIVAGPLYGSEPAWRAQKERLWNIAVRRELPLGSLLVAESGACAYPLKPDQVFLIRANYQRLQTKS